MATVPPLPRDSSVIPQISTASSGREITFSSGPETLRGWLATPGNPGPHPAIVVIHEAWGLNANIREITTRLAGTGYVALAVDLFSDRNRPVCMARFMAGLVFSSLDNRGIDDLRAALTWLTGQPDVDAARLGAVGYCMGGQFSIAWACTDERLKVIAPHYALLPRPTEALARLCPVVGSFPEKDLTAGSGRKLRAALDRSGIEHDIKIYPGARHSFCNPESRAHDPAAAADAWTRMTAFFATRLQSGKGSSG